MRSAAISFVLSLSLSLLLLSPGGSLLFAAAGAAPPTLVLKNIATVSDNIVRIKDIAAMDAGTRKQIGHFVIRVAPEPGETDVIPRNEIYEKLVGNGVSTPKIRGASAVKVVRKGVSIQPSFFKDRILDYVKTHSKWKEGVSLHVVSKKAILVPQSGVRWELSPANGQDFFGDVLFRLKAISKSTNEIIFSSWLVAKLKITRKVAVSNQMIRKGEILSDSHFRWETRQIDAFTKNALLTRKEIIGEKTGRIIRPNSVITSNQMERRYLVQRGGTAILEAKLNNIKASSTVKVLSSGGLGDTVRVMNTVSKKIISAVVTGKNQLEVTVR